MPKRERSGLRDLRRGQIVAAARAIVAEDGLEALTIAALEDRLDFTRGVITYHFRNKDEIVEAVLESAVTEIDAAMHRELATAGTVKERVRAVLHGQVSGWIEHPEAGKILLSFWGRLGSDPRAAAVNAALYRRYREESGAMANEPIAVLLVGIVLGIATQHYFEPGAFDVEAAVDEAAVMVAARLESLRRKAR